MNRNSVTDPVIENFIGKMRQVEEDVARVWGAFALFGLLESEDTPGLWDVLVSAPNLPKGREGILAVARAIQKYLTTSEAVLISRIIPMPYDSDFVRALIKMAPDIYEGYAPIGSFTVNGRAVERGYVLASQERPPLMREVV